MTKHWNVLIVATLVAVLSMSTSWPLARADIVQWEYINPANPSLGKQPCAMLAPDGAGVSAGQGVDLSNRNLTKSYLIHADLGAAFHDDSTYFQPANLAGVNLSQADLTNASLYYSTLTNANFSHAN